MKAFFYKESDKPRWDKAVCLSRNGTFLFRRDFIDYHKDRFPDASLLFTDEDEKHILGLLPAESAAGNGLIRSHGGLTYGGLLLDNRTKLLEVRDMLSQAARLYLDQGFTRLSYRTIPYIYNSYPTEEDLYWLFRSGAQLTARKVSSTIDLNNPVHTSLWKRIIRPTHTRGLTTIRQESRDDLQEYWDILTDVLQSRHHVNPVHSLEEMEMLMQRFPEEIRLYTVKNETGRVIAGTVVFVTPQVVHLQYIAANEEGKQRRALNLLFKSLIGKYAEEGHHYLDFGISTEGDGTYLNEGLIFQKEGCGGRAVCYDTYEVELSALL